MRPSSLPPNNVPGHECRDGAGETRPRVGARGVAVVTIAVAALGLGVADYATYPAPLPDYAAARAAYRPSEAWLYDRNGVPIWACANVDARASHEVSELKELHNHGFEREVYQHSGQTLALSAMPRLLWLAHHRPDIYRQAATLTMISDWLAYMLSGEQAVDPSNAGTTGIAGGDA